MTGSIRRIAKRLAVAVGGAALVAGGVVVTTATPAQALDVYTEPGRHSYNGREWNTTCETYSSNVERCTTEIYATKVTYRNGRFSQSNDWVFNNLTYKPSPRSSWTGNPLATPGYHTISGRRWYTECDTAWTGGNACRSKIWATSAFTENGRYVNKNRWEFNNIVKFKVAPPKPTQKWYDVSAMEEVTDSGFSWDTGVSTIGTKYFPESIHGAVWSYNRDWEDKKTEITYALNGRCTSFTAGIGERSDSANTAKPTYYRVYVDGVLKSGTLSVEPFKGPKTISVDVSKGVQMKLWMHSPAKGGVNAWGAPQLRCWSDPEEG